MGKASRRKRERREVDDESAKALQRRVSKNDRRGRKVGTELADYEAVVQHGPDRLAQTLIARYTSRMDRIRLLSDYERLPILDVLTPVTGLDRALILLGAQASRPPQHPGLSWPDRLAWGIDSCMTAIRLLFCGQVLGAAVVARGQLERWTYLRAGLARTKQAEDEDTADFIARVWSTSDKFDSAALGLDTDEELQPSVRTTVEDHQVPHDHVVLSDGSELCPAMSWVALSELLHGRYLVAATAWDSTELIDNVGWTTEYSEAAGLVLDTLRLCFRQLRLTAADLAEEAGRDSIADMLLSMPDAFSTADQEEGALKRSAQIAQRLRSTHGLDAAMPDPTMSAPTMPEPGSRRSPSAVMFTGLTSPPFPTLMPLTPQEGLSAELVRGIAHAGRPYLDVLAGRRPAGRLFRDDELASLAFTWHRSRYLLVAGRAMEHERVMLGDEFNLNSLTSRWTTETLVTEAASVSARWFNSAELRASAFVMGTGLRSASWLWLEDDDRSMGVLRAVLEQCARFRTWRTKPSRAAKIEAKGSRATPRDWLEAAGWRRLSALNRALGEFAHAMPRSDWAGARELLSMLQGDDVDADRAIYTARGAALELVTNIVADEITAAVRDLSPSVADTLAELLDNHGVELPLDVEARFNHIWAHRRTSTSGQRHFDLVPGFPGASGALVRPKPTSVFTGPRLAEGSVVGVGP